MPKIVVALYRDLNTAEQVVRELVDNGFRRDDIGLVAQNRQNMDLSAETPTEESGSHAASGAGAGAVLGGLAGLVVGLGALAIPGIGPIIAAGPLATTLAGAGIGAVAGGLIGALTSAGVPEQDARAFAEGVRQGGTLVTVRAADDRVESAANIMNGHNPIDINEQTRHFAGSEVAKTTGARYHGVPQDEAGMAQPDVMSPDYRGVPFDDGGLAQPEVDEEVEHRYALPPEEAGMAQPGWNEAEPGLHGVPENEAGMAQPGWNEEASGSQHGMRQGETAGGRPVREYTQPNVSDAEFGKPDLSAEGERELASGRGQESQPVGDFASYEGDFRQHYDLVYVSRGQDYFYYEPAYRFGYDLAGIDKYRGRGWMEIEPDARADWERTQTVRPWDGIREAVRYGWERAAGTHDRGSYQGGSAPLGRSGEDYGTGTGDTRYTDPNNR